jgi:hypothetical protein
MCICIRVTSALYSYLTLFVFAFVFVLKIWKRMWVLSAPHTEGNPRTSPGSSVVIASLFEGVAWYAVLRSAKSVVGILRRAQRLRIIIVFIDSTLYWLYFLFFFFFYLALLVLRPLQPCDCYINIAGRKLISRTIHSVSDPFPLYVTCVKKRQSVHVTVQCMDFTMQKNCKVNFFSFIQATYDHIFSWKSTRASIKIIMDMIY